MAGQEDIRPGDIEEGLDLSAATEEASRGHSTPDSSKDESVSEMGKLAQDRIREQVESELGYTREAVEAIQPPVRVSHHDDLANHGPLHAASAAYRDAQNSRVVESEKERLLKDYDNHVNTYTERHRQAAADEAFRERAEGEAMQNASQRLVEEAQKDPNFNVSRSAQRLKELFDEELAITVDKQNRTIIRQNAALALQAEIAMLKEFDLTDPVRIGRSEDYSRHELEARQLIFSKVQALLQGGELIGIGPMSGLRLIIEHTVRDFAMANGLDPQLEVDRLDRLFIRFGRPDILSQRPGVEPWRSERTNHEAAIMAEALDELDAAA